MLRPSVNMKGYAQDWIIDSRSNFLINIRELFAYKDLLFRLVRKEFLSSYQQTLLGPLWVLFQPILTVLTYVLIFKGVIGLTTEGVPSFPYYLTGITLWNLFSELFLNTASTFSNHIDIFNKVYFPRLIVPLSMVILNLIRFTIQLGLVVVIVVYYHFTANLPVDFFRSLLSLPAVVVVTGIALGSGLIFAVVTTKYKDLNGLLQFIIRLMVFVCPIFYSLSMVPGKLKWLVNLNPLSAQFELFRSSILGTSGIDHGQFLYGFIFMLITLAAGILIFNKMGDKLIDVA